MDIAPNFDQGLPIYVREIKEQYGSCARSEVVPRLVLKTERGVGPNETDCGKVYVNVCTSRLIPSNTAFNFAVDRSATEQHQMQQFQPHIPMVGGPRTAGVGGVTVYDVAVHPDMLPAEEEESSPKSDTSGGNESPLPYHGRKADETQVPFISQLRMLLVV